MTPSNPYTPAEGSPHLNVLNLSAFYGNFQALKNLNLSIDPFSVLALIGPSGCGKTTLLRVFNRMNDLIEGFSLQGSVFINQTNIYSPDTRLEKLRKSVGMVFQKPNPFPKSIFENVAFGLRIQGIKEKAFLEHSVIQSLERVGLWEEVKQTLKKNALNLSGGQQQRLCIARALAVEPSVILMDEPTSSLDPISTGKIEDLIFDLKNDYTIIIVTHNMQQAARISNQTAFLFGGRLIEKGKTRSIFTNPEKKQTESFISGHFS